MTRSLGSNLPGDLLSRLTQRDLSRSAKKRVILVTTVDADAWPRHAMLSYYEVVAKDERSLLALTYAKSQTTNNLQRGGNALFLFVDEEMSYYVRANCKKLGDGDSIGAPREVIFDCIVEDVSEDKLPTAKIESGLTFSGYDPGMSLEDRASVRSKLIALAGGRGSRGRNSSQP